MRHVTPKKVPFSNLYPLPPDYLSLSRDGQRLARLNAITYQRTPNDLVFAWAFFRQYYLRQTREGFFYKRFKESPPFHYQIIHDIGRYPWNAIAAPRGSSKSTILAIEVPMLLLLTRPYFQILLVLSKDTMVTRRMSMQIGYQFQNNPYLLEDFGEVKPHKGQGVWSGHLMQLKNGSVLEGCAARGGKLGARPDLILVDDAEVDPVLNKVTSELKENYERLLVNHLMPMVDEGGSSFYWIGTLLSKQCFLFHVVTTEEDKRFEFWNRRILDAEDNGRGNLLWPEKWSEDFLATEKEKLGVAAYNAQRRNKPGTADEQVLVLDQHINQYSVEEADDTLVTHPLSSKAILRSWSRSPEEPDKVKTIDREFGKSVSRMFRVLTMDYAKCLSPTSDFIAIHVIGIENTPDYKDTWWSLDLLVERISGNTWLHKFWKMACKWKVQYAGVEAVAAQESLVYTARDYIETMAVDGWIPRVVPIKYPYGLSKEDRMGSLEVRFHQGRVKYPCHLKAKWPYRELYHETESFTGLPGASQYDDALDSLAMVQFLVKGTRRTVTVDEDAGRRFNLLSRIERGEPILEEIGGLQAGLGINASELTPEALDALAVRHYNMLEDAAIEAEEQRKERAPCIKVL